MQGFLTPETFEFFARYLLPGFVFLSARARFVQGERPRPAETLIEAVILSLLNQLIFLALFGWILHDASTPGTPAWQLVLEVILLPAATGTLFGWLLGRNFVPASLRRLFMPLTKTVTSASEHAFARLEGPAFVIVGYADGRQVCGLFGDASLASSDLPNGGLYLERLYFVSDEGLWTETDPARAAWISLAGARSIEFIQPEGG